MLNSYLDTDLLMKHFAVLNNDSYVSLRLFFLLCKLPEMGIKKSKTELTQDSGKPIASAITTFRP